MPDVTVRFRTDTAAFDEDPLEVWAVCERVARSVYAALRDGIPDVEGHVLDSNGNAVGTWAIEEPAEEVAR